MENIQGTRGKGSELPCIEHYEDSVDQGTLRASLRLPPTYPYDFYTTGINLKATTFSELAVLTAMNLDAIMNSLID